MSLEGGDLVLSDPSGRVEWEMVVQHVEASEVSRSAWISGVQATRYVGGQKAFRVTAGQATVEWSTKKVSFSGGISAAGTSGALLDAERATWDGARSILEVQGNVRYRDGATTLAGERLHVDESLGKARIIGPGRATVLIAR